MQAITLDVSKKIGGKYVKQGDMTIHVPLLPDFVAELVAAKETEKDEDGMPVYDNPKANFVQSAVLAYVKAAGRNKLISGTAELKPGLKIAETWDELTAEGVRGGGAAALQAIRDLREKFATYVKGLGKSEAAQFQINTLFGSKQALAVATQAKREAFYKYVEAFAETLTEDELERFARPLQAIEDACLNAEADADDMLPD